MTRAEFQQLRRNPHPIVGASVRVLAPTGNYSPDKLINVGAHRWAVKAELGSIFPIRPPWHLELEVGAWLFGDNADFLGATREQQSVFSLETHLVRRFRPGFWASLDANYYAGGRSIVDGEELQDLQRNSRFGVTLVFPFRGRHALKASYSTAVVTESGGNYRSFVLSYSVLLR